MKLTFRRSLPLLMLLGVTVLLVSSLTAPAGAKPCDNNPDDPRCAGATTTTDPPSTTTEPPATTTTTTPPATTTTEAPGTTTTTLPPATTTTGAPGAVAGLGLISGSNGDRYWNAAVGLGLDSAETGMGGGTTHRWCTPGVRNHDDYWEVFEELTPEGAVHVWWYVMTRSNTKVGSDAEAEADWCVAEIKNRRPDATIWVTAMAGFDPDTCQPADVGAAQYLAAYALETYPELEEGPLIPVVADTTDGCHPSGESLSTGADALLAWEAGLYS